MGLGIRIWADSAISVVWIALELRHGKCGPIPRQPRALYRLDQIFLRLGARKGSESFTTLALLALFSSLPIPTLQSPPRAPTRWFPPRRMAPPPMRDPTA